MKNIFLILISLLLVACNSNEYLAANDTLSLNGNWKFHTIYGEGSNYLNIEETENDIVIDNNEPSVKLQGKWRKRTDGARFSKFHGKDYLQHNFTLTELKGGNKADSSYARFYPNFKTSGYYEAFTKFPFSSHLTAQYNVRHAGGTTTKYVSQRTYCNEWISLGIYNFDSKDENYVELTAIVSGAVAADAVMFREISEEKYLTAKEEPKQVFKTDFDDSNWYDLKVPGHWGMINDFSNYTGKGWYRKTLDIPEGWTKSDNRYYLKFGGVYHLSKIYLNGKFIGKNRGGFTPFEFDVTDAINFNGKNVIAVQADNSAIVGATWNWGGIIRDVTLTKNKDIRIDYQYIHGEPDLSKGTADLKLWVHVQNNSDRTEQVEINSKVIFDGNQVTSFDKTTEIPANKTTKVALEVALNQEDVHLWHFDHPNLYKLETTLSDTNGKMDSQQDNFGIRKVELTDSQMLLNGEPVRLAGFNRVSESRFWGSSEPIEVLEEDVDLMKEAGANFMRIMHGTQNEKLIDLCDKKGILLFEEVNVRDLDNDEFRANYYPLAKFEKEANVEINPEAEEILTLEEPFIKVTEAHDFKISDKNYFLSKYWLKGMIQRDINHPSIIGWSVGNELNNHMAYGKAAMAYVKNELDPYRLVTCVSNSGQKEQYTPETDPNTYVDLIMHNMYRWQGEPQEILSTLRTKWPDKPVFISEYGFDPFQSTAPDGDKEIFSEWMNHYRGKNDFVIGTSMWTFNDYRSGYAGTTAEENRVWGIVTSWRQKRRLFSRIKKEHAPIKDIIISNIDLENNTADVSIPIKARGDYPSHNMVGYKLNYQLKSKKAKGCIISHHALDLPTLKPEEGTWKGKITWDAQSENILDLTVSLMAPTGYSRYDKTVSFKKPLTPKIDKIIPGKNAVRVLFDKVPNATEYFVSYQNDKGKEINTSKTISNYIDVDSLSGGKSYDFKLYATNDKGLSNPSEVLESTTNQNLLPPIIWDAFITDNKLVIGYSSDFNDGDYTVRYGNSMNNLDKEFTSNVRGMVSIDLNEETSVFWQIKRKSQTGEESGWSNVVEAGKN